MKSFIKAALAGTLLMSALSAHADSATVNANVVKFEPMVVFIEPGEDVSFTGMIGHNIESIPELSPEGAPEVLTELGEDVTIQFDTVGVHVYKCTPHWGARMGGIVVVGKPENAAGIVEEYLATIAEKKGNLLPAKGLLKKLPKALEAQGM